MTFTEQMITIGMVVLGTVLTRFLPFLIFPAGKPTPRYVRYLGKVLPPAVFGLLVVYCLKNVSLFTGSHGVPEFWGCGWASPLEAADAGFYSGRDCLLYVVGAGGVLG